MKKSPRTRRLEADFRAIQQLAAESSIFEFQSHGSIPESYRFGFHGPGTWKTQRRTVAIREYHEIVVELGAAYPRLMPSINWQTPVFHPNVSSSGIVCLGGYGTNWVPSLKLDELCVMLWDMIRYENYDIQSPYNREAALWTRDQMDFRLPLDKRALRNRVASDLSGVVTAETTNSVKRPPIMVESSRSGVGNGSNRNGYREFETDSDAARGEQDEITFLD